MLISRAHQSFRLLCLPLHTVTTVLPFCINDFSMAFSKIKWLLVPLVTAVYSIRLATATPACYYPNGDFATEDVPCSSGEAGICCPLNWQCLNNGLCYLQNERYYERHTCSDRNWPSDSCPHICTYGMQAPYVCQSRTCLVRANDIFPAAMKQFFDAPTRNIAATEIVSIHWQMHESVVAHKIAGSGNCCTNKSADFFDLPDPRVVQFISVTPSVKPPSATSQVTSSTSSAGKRAVHSLRRCRADSVVADSSRAIGKPSATRTANISTISKASAPRKDVTTGTGQAGKARVYKLR